MQTKYTIRPATEADATSICQIVLNALRVNNALDYPQSVIERLSKSFTPQTIKDFIQDRTVFVAEKDQTVVGTASLDNNVVRTVFIAPDMQRQGIGRQLMNKVEEVALNASVPLLLVPSSITAVSFYEKLGFQQVREEFHDEEKTIILKRALSA